ncbi:MAG: molybdenum cofactor guanylyltransferase [Oscillospiraceae bacterium]|nr:molybdenum cofactor guanylyltransferase [Oscillospiraceae bacterium]
MKTAAVILAGGKSSRMGRDKAMLPFGEDTMLSHLVGLYRPWFDLTAVSLNVPGRFQTYGAMEVVDRHPGDGPLAGLEAAFLDTRADVIFLTATDLPFGDPALALRLLERLGEHDVCLIHHDGRAETLFAVYSSACLPAVRRSLDAGRRSMFHVLEQVDTLRLTPQQLPEFDLDHILRNVNDPEEYRRALALIKGRETEG